MVDVIIIDAVIGMVQTVHSPIIVITLHSRLLLLLLLLLLLVLLLLLLLLETDGVVSTVGAVSGEPQPVVVQLVSED